jgi:hypothetical protein
VTQPPADDVNKLSAVKKSESTKNFCCQKGRKAETLKKVRLLLHCRPKGRKAAVSQVTLLLLLKRPKRRCGNKRPPKANISAAKKVSRPTTAVAEKAKK